MGVGADALRGVQREQFKTADPERAHEFLRQEYAEHSVRFSGSPEGFTFVHTETSARRFSLRRIRHSMASVAEVDSLGGMLIVQQILGGRLEFDDGHDTVRASRSQPVLLPPSRPVRIEWDDLDVGFVTLDPAALARCVAGADGIDPAGLEFISMEPVSAQMGRHWQSVVRHVARDVLPNAEAIASPLICGQTERLLAATLLATFPNTALDALMDVTASATVVEPTALRRAVAFIDAHAGEDIGIAEIADAARIGRRGLQRAFRHYRDTTPMEYLRRVRLDHAHRELQAADPARGDTVIAVATRWGFTHAGRFSVVYHEAYGCSPSQTLRR